MPVDIGRLLAERDHVDKVLAHLQSEHSAYHSAPDAPVDDDGNTMSSGSSGTSMILEALRKPFLAPMDAWKLKGAYRTFGAKRDTDTGTDTDTAMGGDGGNHKVETLAQLQLAVLAAKGVSLTARQGSVVPRRVMLPIKAPGQAFPSSVPLCPDVQALEDAFLAEDLSLQVHSTDGYNFSSEFENVYKAQISSASAPADFATICARALLVFDPSLTSEVTAAYASFIGRMALWERSVAYVSCVCV